MKKQKAFTLIEVLIAMFISSFIIFGMIQIYRNLQKFIDNTYNIIRANKKIYLLFSQFERDFSTALIPKLNKEEKKGNIYFLGEIFIGEYTRINNEKFELFKSLNFVNTNPLCVYNQRDVKLVRISYILKKNKKLSNTEREVYDLYRNETSDLSNFSFKEIKNIRKKDKTQYVKTYLIAKNIKYFSVKYYGFNHKGKNSEKKEKSMTSSFRWGKNKETFNVLPRKIFVKIIFWTDNFKSEDSFESIIKVWSIFPDNKN